MPPNREEEDPQKHNYYARYRNLHKLRPDAIEELYNRAVTRLRNLNPSRPHDQREVRRLQESLETYRRVARERGIPLDPRMLELEASFRAPHQTPSAGMDPEGTEQPKRLEPARSAAHAGGTDRRAAVDAYIAEVLNRTGKTITRTDIWKAAKYKTRTQFERWERHDKRETKAADEAFTRILFAEKPHLK
jgi:hypothetical protein